MRIGRIRLSNCRIVSQNGWRTSLRNPTSSRVSYMTSLILQDAASVEAIKSFMNINDIQLTDYMNKSDHSMPPFLMPGTESLTEGHSVKIDRNDNNVKFEKNGNNGNLEDAKKIDGPTSQRRKRKGIPHRVPFF
ncbi:hypothetical protein QQ045_010160 [Rhodiola kirilowii]